MAPSTPPPPSKIVFAAFTIASTASLVMSPRMRFSCDSAILPFVNQANAASVLIKRPRPFHRTRVAVQRKSFDVRMGLTPFRKCAADSAFPRHVEIGGESAHIMKNEETARREGRIPEIELSEG